MQHENIINRLAQLTDSCSEVIYAITMQSYLTAIAHSNSPSLGEKALALFVDDLHLACDEVRAALEHCLDKREYIDIGLDSWEVIRNL